ncbi:MAG: HAD family hydrolase [Rickettsiales bacterium]|nr:HAD family hydrolase [Rickettsiales bacterium]
MKFKKPKLVCYDWDNTLVNTVPVTLISMNMLYKKYNLPELSVEDIYKINGYSFEQVFVATFGKKYSKNIQDEYQVIYNQVAENMLQPINGSLDTVKKIYNFGIKQVVISNKPGNIVRYEAEKFGYSKYFEIIIGPNDSGYAKPDIRMFNPIKETNLFKDKWFHPDKLWFFGDADADLNFAKVINARLFFLGDKKLVNNFPTDQLVMLNSHNDIQKLEIIEE